MASTVKQLMCANCGQQATQITQGEGHACGVFFKRAPFVHCAECTWPDNFLYPKSEPLKQENIDV
jgi:hypothetical protein